MKVVRKNKVSYNAAKDTLKLNVYEGMVCPVCGSGQVTSPVADECKCLVCDWTWSVN